MQTFQEWSDFYKCHKQYSRDLNNTFTSLFRHGRLKKELREEFVDWRDRGAVTQVKNQVHKVYNITAIEVAIDLYLINHHAIMIYLHILLNTIDILHILLNTIDIAIHSYYNRKIYNTQYIVICIIYFM